MKLEVAKQKEFNKKKSYLNTSNFSFQCYLSEVNKQSLRQILIAFLRERILEYYFHREDLFFKLPRLNSLLCVSPVKLNSLSRFTEFDKVFVIDKKNTIQAIVDPINLLEIVKRELDTIFHAEQWDKVSREVSNHIQNAVLITWQKDKIKKESFSNLSEEQNNFFNFLRNKHLSDYSFKFEQLSFNGHPYHPFAKTKIGFSKEDILKYTTEFRPKVFVLLAAVRKDIIGIETTEKEVFSDWFSRQYTKAWESWTNALTERKLNYEDYVPFPIHPWQAENIINDLFTDHIDSKGIILFDNIRIESSPTSSFRTLAPMENWYAPYMKLPIGIYASGVFRALSVKSIQSAPKITRIMKQVLISEDSISKRIAILPEVYGLYLNSIQDDKARHFTAIFRENITNYLANNEVAIVVAALFERFPVSNLSLFIELIKLAGCLDYQTTLNYFYRYVDLVLGSYLDLYLLYGIALEGHQQNTLAVFENGHIKRFIARDFDGIEIYADSLNCHNFDIDTSLLPPPFVTNDKITVRNQLLHTVYQLHLGELVLLLAAYFGCEEKIFWNIIREKTEERFVALKGRMKLTRWKDEYNAILKEKWPVKALFRMRLGKEYKGIFSQMPNPLV